jgi:hypothetical protein
MTITSSMDARATLSGAFHVIEDGLAAPKMAEASFFRMKFHTTVYEVTLLAYLSHMRDSFVFR